MTRTLNSLVLAGAVTAISGCASPPDFTGYAVNTPDYYRENKVFYAAPLDEDNKHSAVLVRLDHLHEFDSAQRKDDLFVHGAPISVVLQTVRLPSDLPTGPTGTIDVAVLLDIHTSSSRGLTTLLAFYQRDVPPGQELNFKNLIVYADPMWDSANPPYFRVRVLDVRSERNRATTQLLSKVSNLSGEISGLIPHPAIPLVTTAIDAAALVLGNQRNRVLLDYQIQFFSQEQVAGAGGATLGPLSAGTWFVVGRARDQTSEFWRTPMFVDRETGMVMTPQNEQRDPAEGVVEPAGHAEVLVPYVAVALLKADAEVPKLVLDRSEALLALLSAPSGKSDVDALEQIKDNLVSAVNGYVVERRLRKYRSVEEIGGLIGRLRPVPGGAVLNAHEERRIKYVLRALTSLSHTNSNDWITWWNGIVPAQYELVDAPNTPLGLKLQLRSATPPQ